MCWWALISDSKRVAAGTQRSGEADNARHWFKGFIARPPPSRWNPARGPVARTPMNRWSAQARIIAMRRWRIADCRERQLVAGTRRLRRPQVADVHAFDAFADRCCRPRQARADPSATSAVLISSPKRCRSDSHAGRPRGSGHIPVGTGQAGGARSEPVVFAGLFRARCSRRVTVVRYRPDSSLAFCARASIGLIVSSSSGLAGGSVGSTNLASKSPAVDFPEAGAARLGWW